MAALFSARSSARSMKSAVTGVMLPSTVLMWTAPAGASSLLQASAIRPPSSSAIAVKRRPPALPELRIFGRTVLLISECHIVRAP